LTLEELYRPVQTELSLVQTEVTRFWGEALALLHGPSLAPPKVGGKLLRPALCLLAAGSSGATDMGFFAPMATACELLHMAALTHDDVIDKADFRRGMVSLNALWDDRTAVLSGDYLVTLAVGLLTSFNSCPLIVNTIEAVRRMTEGELASFARNAERFTEDDCLQLAEQKTATLFAATCTAPTFLLGPTYRDALHQYGLALGVAFQLIDDILDIAQDQAALGKPSCRDIVEGKRTLPIRFIREGLAAAEQARLNQMVGRAIGDQDRRWAAEALERSGARAKTVAVARRYADTALAALAPLPPTVYRDSMFGLVEFVLIRDS
jgi:octaprenyl-diphosphate synthase